MASVYLGGRPVWIGGVISGGTQVNVNTQTANYTATPADDVILVDATAGGITLTLPAASNGKGTKLLIIKLDSSGNAVTVTPAGADTIEGNATKSLAAQYNKIGLVSDGVSLWYDLGTGGQ